MNLAAINAAADPLAPLRSSIVRSVPFLAGEGEGEELLQLDFTDQGWTSGPDATALLSPEFSRRHRLTRQRPGIPGPFSFHLRPSRHPIFGAAWPPAFLFLRGYDKLRHNCGRPTRATG